VNTGYNRFWIRDNIYAAIGLEAVDPLDAVKTYQAIFDILLKHEYKLDNVDRIHPRYDITLTEVPEPWGNKQNDAIGAFIFKVCDLTNKGIKVIRSNADLRILQKLVHYLKSIEYWHDKDNGMWEENEEVHASSVGACVAALKLLKNTKFRATGALKSIEVPKELINAGIETLNHLLPRESATNEVDLALLSLIYPYNVVSEEQRDTILNNVEQKLLRNKGVIRYLGDKYYMKDGKEAEWTFGLAWLSIICKQMNDGVMSRYYLEKTLRAMNPKGELPELYYGETSEHNENTPLAWSMALMLEAMR
jgi:phosphorylase kinase alpha/beta subunit